METIAIFALIMATLALVKILIILVKPRAWYNLVKAVWKAPTIVMLICLILAAMVFYSLLQELSLVQIMAVVLFVALLGGVTAAVYSKEVVSLAGKMLNDRKFMRKAWLPIIIWLILVLWALKEILL